MELPSPKHNPYKAPIFEHEIDLDFGEDFSEKEKSDARQERRIVSCASLRSRISSEKIMYLIEHYNLAGKWRTPRSFTRMHVFETVGLPTPRMVLTNKLVELGIGWPMHPFLHELIDYHQIAPIQLSPNSYRAAIGLYMIYRNNGFEIRHWARSVISYLEGTATRTSVSTTSLSGRSIIKKV